MVLMCQPTQNPLVRRTANPAKLTARNLYAADADIWAMPLLCPLSYKSTPYDVAIAWVREPVPMLL